MIIIVKQILVISAVVTKIFEFDEDTSVDDSLSSMIRQKIKMNS